MATVCHGARAVPVDGRIGEAPGSGMDQFGAVEVADLAPVAAVLISRILLIGVERVLLRRIGSVGGPTECAAVFFGVGALVLLPFAHLGQIQDWDFLRLAVPSGLIYAVAYWFYVSALSGGEVAAVAPLSAANAAFVVLLAFLMHGEPISPTKVGGAGLIAAGAAFLQRRAPAAGVPAPSIRRPRLAAASWQMLAYAGLSALTRMLDKANASAARSAPAGTYGLVVFSVVAAAEFTLVLVTGRLPRFLTLLGRQPIAALAAGTCNGISFLLLLVALTLMPVSVAEPITSLSLLVTAALAWLWLREPVGARWLPTVAIIVGTWLLVADGVVVAPALAG